MRSTQNSRTKKSTSLSPETLRIQHQLRQKSVSNRKHWDLFKHLYNPHLIHDAILLVMKNGGSPGLDNVTIKSIRERGSWSYALEVTKKLRARSYNPTPVKRVFIAKKDGTKRPLGVPRIEDRVVQTALWLLMSPIYEERFHDFSYGFRPKRRAVDCVAKLAEQVYRQRQVLEADIQSFFDHVSHKRLMKYLEREIVDGRVKGLIWKFLTSGFQEPGKPWEKVTRGTPQGGPLSPLLANVYLHYALDQKFHHAFGKSPKISLFRYADDFVVTAKYVSDLKSVRTLIVSWLGEVGLGLKESKTRFVDMSNEARSHASKFDFLGFKIHLRSFRDNPERFWIARQPSQDARKALRSRLRKSLMAHMSLAEAGTQAVQIWRGWSEYFRYSNANRIFYRECRKVKNTITRYLARKFRRQRCPVPMWRIYQLGRPLYKLIRPIQVIPNHLSESVQIKLAIGRA